MVSTINYCNIEYEGGWKWELKRNLIALFMYIIVCKKVSESRGANYGVIWAWICILSRDYCLKYDKRV